LCRWWNMISGPYFKMGMRWTSSHILYNLVWHMRTCSLNWCLPVTDTELDAGAFGAAYKKYTHVRDSIIMSFCHIVPTLTQVLRWWNDGRSMQWIEMRFYPDTFSMIWIKILFSIVTARFLLLWNIFFPGI